MIDKSHPNQGCKFLECFSCFYLSPNCWEKHQLHKLNWLQSVTVFIPQSNRNVRIISAFSFCCLQWHSGGKKKSPVLPSSLGWNATADCRGPPACRCCYCCSTLSPLSSTLPVKMRECEIFLRTPHKHTYTEITFTASASHPLSRPPRSKQQMWTCFTAILLRQPKLNSSQLNTMQGKSRDQIAHCSSKLIITDGDEITMNLSSCALTSQHRQILKKWQPIFCLGLFNLLDL